MLFAAELTLREKTSRINIWREKKLYETKGNQTNQRQVHLKSHIVFTLNTYFVSKLRGPPADVKTETVEFRNHLIFRVVLPVRVVVLGLPHSSPEHDDDSNDDEEHKESSDTDSDVG